MISINPLISITYVTFNDAEHERDGPPELPRGANCHTQTVASDPSAEPLWRLCARRILQGACPQCGRGALFRARFRLHERCEHCGLVYRREHGAELGSMTLVSVLSELFAGALFLLVWLCTDWGAWTALCVSVPATLVFCYLSQRWCMAAWVGIDYLTDVSNSEWWAKPRR